MDSLLINSFIIIIIIIIIITCSSITKLLVLLSLLLLSYIPITYHGPRHSTYHSLTSAIFDISNI